MQKNELLGNELTKRTYRALADITEENCIKMFSFLRFVEFDGDIMILVEAKMIDEKKKTDKDEGYKAENLNVLSVHNELKVHQKLKSYSEFYLQSYPNDLEQDDKLLAQDDKQQFLSFNQRNCVLFRKGEKEILHWFIEFSSYCTRILSLKWKDAKKEAASLPKRLESARDYIQ